MPAELVAFNRRWSLLVRVMPMLRAYVRSLVRNSQSAEDVAQEASLSILLSEAPDEDTGRFSAWSRGVARHVAARERRRSRKGEVACGDEVPDTADPRGDPERRASASEVLEQVTLDLDADSMELLVRRYVLEESAKELATELAQSPAAMRMRLMRLRSAIRDEKE